MFRNVSFVLLLASLIVNACGVQPTAQISATTIVATAYPAPTASPTQARSVIVSTPKAQIEDGGIDQTDVPTTVAWLHQQYGRFFSAAIVRQVLGENPSLTLEVGGEQFLVKEDVLVNDPEGGVLWPSYSDEVPFGPGLMIITRDWPDGGQYVCFISGAKVPEVIAWVDLAILEGQYVRGNAQDVCYDTLVILDDGRGVYLYNGYVISQNGDFYVEGPFAGYVHGEFSSMILTDAPRDSVKDAQAIKYAEALRGLPGDWYGKPGADYVMKGPLDACIILVQGWSHLPGLSAATVESLCGRLPFNYRYDVISLEGEGGNGYISDWFIGTARVAMTNSYTTLTQGDVYRLDFRTFIEVVSTYDGQCKDEEIEVWINQISQGAVASRQFCVSPAEYVFVLSEASYDPQTDEYWIPEGVLNFKFKIN